MSRSRNPAAGVPPVPPAAPGPEGSAAGEGDLDRALATIRATGASMGEALGLVAVGFEPDLIRPLLTEALWHGADGGRLDGDDAVGLLHDVAELVPDLARWGFADWARDGVFGDLDLSGQQWVTVLPERLLVEGDLDLTGLKDLRALPPGLEVMGDLVLFGCPWLDRLPPDLTVLIDLLLDQGCPLMSLSERKLRDMVPQGQIRGEIRKFF